MDERENDQLRKCGNEPAEDFPSEWELPRLSTADVPKEETVWRGDTDVIVLSADQYSENEFPSERDLGGYTARSLLSMAPVESVQAGSLAGVRTVAAPEAHAWLGVTFITRLSMGLGVVALGAAIYATLPGQLAVAPYETVAPIAADATASVDATVPNPVPEPTSDPLRPELQGREASAVARPQATPPAGLAQPIASRPEGGLTGSGRRSALTAGIPEESPERPREGLVDPLRRAPDTSAVTEALTALAAPSEPLNETPISGDVATPGTTSERPGGELAAVPAATERLVEAPPEPRAARDAGSVAAPLAPPPTAVVQGVLARYAQAYGRLDASAVKAIWPTVDERALARAFSGLEAQSIMFDACDLRIDGTRATAACRGTATYVTGVGKRSQVTQPRQWTFLLEQSPDRWEIQRIQVQ